MEYFKTRYLLASVIALAAGFIGANSSYACQVINRGAQDNSDCPSLIKQIYIHEAVAPDMSKLSHSILNTYTATDHGLVDNGLMSVLSIMDKSAPFSLCLSDSRNLFDSFGRFEESDCIFGRNAVLDQEKLSSKARPLSFGNAYVVKQWSNIFISIYGYDKDIQSPEKLREDRFLISFVDQGPLPALKKTNVLDSVFNESFPLRLREYSFNMFYYFYKNEPKEMVYNLLMKVIKDIKSSDKMKITSIEWLSHFNDPQANKAMLDLYYDLSVSDEVARYVLRFFPNSKDSRYILAVAEALSGSFRRDNGDQALIMARVNKINQVENSIIEMLNNRLKNRDDSEGPKGDGGLFLNLVDTLGEIGSQQALVVLLDVALYNSDDVSVRNGVRAAVVKIKARTGSRL